MQHRIRIDGRPLWLNVIQLEDESWSAFGEFSGRPLLAAGKTEDDAVEKWRKIADGLARNS